jgi:hypothetical protein
MTRSLASHGAVPGAGDSEILRNLVVGPMVFTLRPEAHVYFKGPSPI